MSTFTASRLSQNRVVLATTIFAVCGWIITFGGACALQTLYGAWWVVVYQALLVCGTILTIMSGSILQYRLVLLTFIGASIPLLTIQVDYVLQYTKPSVPRDPANAYAVGYVILIIVQYAWVVVFGSDPSSYFGQFGQISGAGEAVSSLHQQTSTYPPTVMGEKHLDFPADKRLASNGMQPVTTVMPTYQANNNYLQQPQSATMVPAHAPAPQDHYLPPATEYREKVEALHAYNANPEDPNELSFTKGEVLEVVDRKGNWWQARKADGAIGIIPSNYFAPPSNQSSPVPNL
ncbi:hypothetical protein BCR43DRAFT_498045 [Syncephalastrum racemosum]|uniref:SH3 domain-containing protein n=1 Tax=Syncephalastrum racemosum TaxID=13706 RepID=A0A1X2H359_SYNRA|nr:hypothetical protein BCR43DRAFT_498045 [Syncephalastrum racemosum]